LSDRQAQKQREGEDNQCSCSGFVGRRLIKRSKGGKRVWAFLGKTESEEQFLSPGFMIFRCIQFGLATVRGGERKRRPGS